MLDEKKCPNRSLIDTVKNMSAPHAGLQRRQQLSFKRLKDYPIPCLGVKSCINPNYK